MILSFLIAATLPTLIGWTFIRVLEGKTPILYGLERACLSWVLGASLAMYLTFVCHTLQLVAINRWGFVVVQILTLLVLIAIAHFKQITFWPRRSDSTPRQKNYRWYDVIIGVLTLWIGLKIFTAAALLLTSLPFHDDVIHNWNTRAQHFFYVEKITLYFDDGFGDINTGGVNSYPPNIPLVKAWFASVHGTWYHGLVNSMHMLWFLAALGLVFYCIRRDHGRRWGWLGLYGLSSLPLYLMHSSVGFADMMMSVHVFAAVSQLYLAMKTTNATERQSHWRLSIASTALLVFTKNEGAIIYLPTLLILHALAYLKTSAHRTALLRFGLSIAAVALPWLIFKWYHGLTFGNAKAVTGVDIGWQTGVLHVIGVNIFLEGNWLLLYPVLIGLVATQWSVARRYPLAIFTLAIGLIVALQLGMYLFTELSLEAKRQTGLARGFVHIAPLSITLCVFLFKELWQKSCSKRG